MIKAKLSVVYLIRKRSGTIAAKLKSLLSNLKINVVKTFAHLGENMDGKALFMHRTNTMKMFTTSDDVQC